MDSFSLLSYVAMNRTTIALVVAVALVHTGGIGYKDAFVVVVVDYIKVGLPLATPSIAFGTYWIGMGD